MSLHCDGAKKKKRFKCDKKTMAGWLDINLASDFAQHPNYLLSQFSEGYPLSLREYLCWFGVIAGFNLWLFARARGKKKKLPSTSWLSFVLTCTKGQRAKKKNSKCFGSSKNNCKRGGNEMLTRLSWFHVVERVSLSPVCRGGAFSPVCALNAAPCLRHAAGSTRRRVFYLKKLQAISREEAKVLGLARKLTGLWQRMIGPSRFLASPPRL